ncbi:peptidase [Flavobacterium sp. NG2]|uniref:peptidase n=1 Tax=Flavobacterium sp. NG2 TaxID=3097547 RepID=UPI002A83E46F|nr:peptidase [Flavobacterium sp. NG2]WPR72260.1 peptidase [Flavobacterium sp. NG2]
MSEKRLKRKKLQKKLFTKNRLVILNEDTFEEIFSLKLTLMNVFVVATLGAIILISITTFIIAFTPLREYIPGYSSSKLKRDATELSLKSDSLIEALKKNEAYIQSIQKVLNGQLEYAKFNKDSILNLNEEPAPQLKMTASEEELKLREQVDAAEKAATQLAKEKQQTTKKRK